MKRPKKPIAEGLCMKSGDSDEIMRKALGVDRPDSTELTKAARKGKAGANRKRGKGDRNQKK